MTPSGPALCRLISREISASTGQVLELGAGTGVFTRALLARGVAERDLTIVEMDKNFCALLAARHPTAKVLSVDASTLGTLDGVGPFGAAVSGLPLLAMPDPKVQAILAGVFATMAPGGALYQFTYGPRCPVRKSIMDVLGLKAVRIGRALANLPPAAVYRISRA